MKKHRCKKNPWRLMYARSRAPGWRGAPPWAAGRPRRGPRPGPGHPRQAPAPHGAAAAPKNTKTRLSRDSQRAIWFQFNHASPHLQLGVSILLRVQLLFVSREVTLEAMAIIIEIVRTASGRHTASHSVTPTTVLHSGPTLASRFVFLSSPAQCINTGSIVIL